MSPLVRRAVIVCALIGLAAASTSTYVHYQLVQDPAYTSFCDVNEGVSCTRVYQSRFGTVGDVPVALLGAFWFGLVLFLTVAAGRGSAALTENVGSYLLVLSTFGLAMVLFLGYESVAVLGIVCLLCVAVYASVVGIFIASSAIPAGRLLSLPRRVVDDFGRLVRTPTAFAVLVSYVVLMLVVGMGFLVEPTNAFPPTVSAANSESATSAGAGESEFERFWNAEPRVELPVPREGAKVLILKFNDYQCPSCAQSHFLYEPILARYESSHPGAVRQVSLDYPLDPECNEYTPRGGHMGACEAAVAVRLARRDGRDAQMARWLYENQETMSLETVRQGLVDVAGMTDFDELYEATLNDVKGDIELGNLIDIDATPTFVINGVTVKGGLRPELLETAIALELDRVSDDSGAE